MSRWTEETLGKMTLEQKVGQLTWFYIRGEGKLAVVERMIKEGKIGAVILSSWDMKNPKGAAELTNRLQELAEVPLLMAADFEAGVGLLVKGATQLPNNMAIGATGSPEMAHLCGELTARESRAIGIHMPIAPVVDVNVNPKNPIINTRSFGESEEMVSKLGVAFVEGVQANGAIAVAKHFPGHGDTDVDSHRSMPVIPHDRERMDRVELRPYRDLIAAGIRAIMSAHIHFPAIDPTPGLPGTLSEKIMTGLLREELGFDGLAVTDAMEMWAITHNFGMGEAVVMAAQAGIDLILAGDPEVSYDALLKAATEGRISNERLNSAVGRILEAKAWLGLDKGRVVPVEKVDGLVGTADNRKRALDVARASITLVKGEEFLRRLDGSANILIVSTRSQRYTGDLSNDYLNKVLCDKCSNAKALVVEEEPTSEDASKAIELAGQADKVIFATFVRVTAYKEGSTSISSAQVDLANKLCRMRSTAVISYGSPYVLRDFKEAEALICAYSDSDVSIQASIEVLLEEREAKGRLPVTLLGL